jgi:endonuclease/exonuclease/phosphatase family metal-dependent hydrolase
MKFYLINIIVLLFSFSLHADFKVSTFNIRNFDKDRSGTTDLNELKKMLTSLDSEVIGFQEVVNTKLFQEFILQNFSDLDLTISNCGGSGRQKLALVYNKNKFELRTEFEDLSFSSVKSTCGTLRPVYFVTLREKTTKKEFLFGLIHFKAGGSKEAMEKRWYQYRLLLQKSRELKDENFFLMGDFNTTGYISRDEDYLEFRSFLEEAQLSTTADSLECTSYWNGGRRSGFFYPSLLDHILVSDALRSKIKKSSSYAHCLKQNCQISTLAELGDTFQKVSDHCPLSLEIQE